MSSESTPAMPTGFGPGTMIDTNEGAVPVEWLTSTHRVITRRGAEPVAGLVRVDPSDIDSDLIQIQPGAFWDNKEDDPLLLAGGQRVLLSGDDLSLFFGLDIALAEAPHLLGHKAVSAVAPQAGIPLFGVSMRPGAIIRANGVWIEASRPGGMESLRGYPCLADWECKLLIGMRGVAQEAGLQAVA